MMRAMEPHEKKAIRLPLDQNSEQWEFGTVQEIASMQPDGFDKPTLDDD